MVDRRRETIFIHLGRLSIYYNNLEWWLSNLIWMLIGPDPHIGIIVTARMNMSTLQDLAKKLFIYRIKDEQDTATFEELLKEIHQAADERNKYIHSAWVVGLGAPSESITRIKYTSKSSGRSGVLKEELPEEVISEVVDFVRRVSHNLLGFNFHLIEKGYFPDYIDKFFHMFDTELDEEEQDSRVFLGD